MNKKLSAFLLATMLLATVPLAEAQQPKVYRVGIITAGGAWYEVIDGLRAGLKQLGLEEGKQFTLKSEIPRAMQRRRRKRQGVSNERKST